MEGQGDDRLGRKATAPDAILPSLRRSAGEWPEVVEEVPTMRSVALSSTSSSNALRGHGFPPPPALGLHQRSPQFLMKPDAKLSRVGNEGLMIKKEWSGQVKIPASWVLKNDKLEPVPVDFPLERTHREIYNVDPGEVAIRISDALRILSIEAEYDCEQAKAKCRTADMVSFRIRLYAGGENNQPVVVEVQRRSGSGFSFMQSCRAILDAAEGSKLTLPSKKRGLPPFMNGPVGDMSCLKGIAPPPKLSSNPAAIDPLERVISLIGSKKRDENILGMENLGFLTDPLKTLPCTALRVCKIVALGDTQYTLRSDTLALLQQDMDVAYLDPEELESSTFGEQMRHLALTVFSNSLSMTGKDGSLSAALVEQDWYGDCLIPALLEEMKNARVRTNCAYEAACCVSSLVEASPVARRLFHEHDSYMEILKSACVYGEARHELLANEMKRCMAALE